MAPVSSQLIRDIVEQNPDVMAVLAGFGLDLCCGGGHSLEEACALHRLDLNEVLTALGPVLPHDNVAAQIGNNA